MYWRMVGHISRWVKLASVTPSGKAIFVCRYCGEKTAAPTDECNASPYVSGPGVDMSCKQMEDRDREKLFHPILEAAISRLTTLDAKLSSIKTKRGRIDLLRKDRELIVRLFKHAVFARSDKHVVNLFDVHDDFEKIREELRKK